MSPEGRRLRVVADTNVLFSALAFPKDTPPSNVVALARARRIDLYASPFILEELEQTLRRKAAWTAGPIQVLRKMFKPFLLVVEPKRHVDIIKRIEADNRILECALEAHADVLVTGNMKDIRPLGSFRGIAIFTPREFLDTYFPKPTR